MIIDSAYRKQPTDSLGTGNALANGGPLGLFMGYALMGSICYSVMISLGEMIAYLPIAGGHIALAARFVDPALSFAIGWNYVVSQYHLVLKPG